MSHSVGPSYVVAAHDFTEYVKFTLGRLLKINLGHFVTLCSINQSGEEKKKKGNYHIFVTQLKATF